MRAAESPSCFDVLVTFQPQTTSAELCERSLRNVVMKRANGSIGLHHADMKLLPDRGVLVTYLLYTSGCSCSCSYRFIPL